MKQIKRTAAILLSGALLTLTACTAAASGNSSPESSAASAVSREAEETSAERSETPESSRPESSRESSSEQSAVSSEPSKEDSSAVSSEEPESSEESSVLEVEEPSMERASIPESKPVEVSAPWSKPESKAPESKAPESKAPESKTPESSAEESRETSRPKPAPTPAGTAVDASWFDDAVFVGDSVTLKLSYYADNGSLGDAQFLCAGSLGYGNALWDLYREGNVHPFYNGTKVTVDDGLRQINPNKIFIMLGMNDIGLYGVNDSIENMKTLTSRIEAKCPSAEIYIESVTPMLADSQLRDLNNRTIAEFDEKLQAVCAERGYRYMDIASVVSDGYGNLVYEYCSDASAMGLHFSDAGCYQWVEYLKTHVS